MGNANGIMSWLLLIWFGVPSISRRAHLGLNAFEAKIVQGARMSRDVSTDNLTVTVTDKNQVFNETAFPNHHHHEVEERELAVEADAEFESLGEIVGPSNDTRRASFPNQPLRDPMSRSSDKFDSLDIAMTLRAIGLGYSLTSGTYYKDDLDTKTRNEAIYLRRGIGSEKLGWRREPDLDLNPPDGVNGVHGIVLSRGRRAIIVIRGTDWPTDKSDCEEDSGCRSDLCADKKLFDISTDVIEEDELPSWCKATSASHEYPAQAERFVLHALDALASDVDDILLVGHSLGAALAILVGARILGRSSLPSQRTLRVIAVSAPPFDSLLANFQLDSTFFVLIYNDLDPALFATMNRGGFAGLEPLCYSMEDLRDEARDSCREECLPLLDLKKKPPAFGAVWPDECDLCFRATHNVIPYLKAASEMRALSKCDV